MFSKIKNLIKEKDISNLKKGAKLNVGNHSVKIDSKIAEGGYGSIYKVIDTNSQAA